MIIGSLQIDSRRDSVLWRIDKGPNMLILVGSINLILSLPTWYMMVSVVQLVVYISRTLKVIFHPHLDATFVYLTDRTLMIEHLCIVLVK